MVRVFGGNTDLCILQDQPGPVGTIPTPVDSSVLHPILTEGYPFFLQGTVFFFLVYFYSQPTHFSCL